MNIKIDLKIFLFLLLFLLTSQIEIYLILMSFASIHEVAHLLTGMILGFKPQELNIMPSGLQVSFKVKCEEYNKKIKNGNGLSVKKLIIAMVGPLSNFCIAMLLILLNELNILRIQNNIYQNMVYANFLIGIFNLIPIYPLDGGRILNEILHILTGLRKSYKYTYTISKITIIVLTVIASIAILYIQNIAILLILGYLWILVLRERKIYHTRENILRVQQNFNKIEMQRLNKAVRKV